MNDDLYKQSFDTAINELSELVKELNDLDDRRETVSERILKVRRGVIALSPLIGEDPKNIERKFPELFPNVIPPDTGLTEAVRKILMSSAQPLTPTGVRSELEKAKFDLNKYKNPLASIHTTLKRLAETDGFQVVNNDSVTRYWRVLRLKRRLTPLGQLIPVIESRAPLPHQSKNNSE